jgi:hypothetical protein
MLYRDIAYCGSDCTNTTCNRYFGENEKVKAGAWWPRLYSKNAKLAIVGVR